MPSQKLTCMMPVNWVSADLRLSGVKYFNMTHVHIRKARSSYKMGSMEILIGTIHVNVVAAPISIVVR